MIFAMMMWHRRWKMLAIVASIVASWPTIHIKAQTSNLDIYAVSGIEVDVVAESAAKARELAMNEAQREGLRRLFQRLTSEDFYVSLPPVEGVSLNRVVRSIEVDDERLAATSYAASISISYDEEAIQGILQSSGIPSVLSPSDPILVVPLLQSNDGSLLWSDAGPWWNAWSAEVDRNTILRLVLPLGDLSDATTLRAQDDNVAVQEALTQIGQRYGAEAAIIARAEPEYDLTSVDSFVGSSDGVDNGSADPHSVPIAVVVDVIDRWNWPFAVSSSLVSDYDLGMPEKIWREGVRAIIASLEEEWKRSHLIRYDQISSIVAGVAITDLERWIEVRRSLNQLPEIRKVSIDSISRIGAEVTIEHIGDMARLSEGLERQGLELQQQDGEWALSRLSRELPQRNIQETDPVNTPPQLIEDSTETNAAN